MESLLAGLFLHRLLFNPPLGFFTGAIHREEITEILTSSGGIDDDVYQMVNNLLGLALDLEDQNGECNEMSVGLVYSGAEIYLLPDETE